ncbi:MAG: hypothetical protein Q8L48_12420 [Archangium sp.]|nr:hypothetical protein [Archangium sp.]
MSLRAMVLSLTFLGCVPPPAPEPLSDVTALFDPEGRFYAAPFPAPWRARADGTLEVSDFPTHGNGFAQRYVTMLEQHAEGWGRNAGFWFPLSGDIDEASLPATPEASAGFDSAIYLVNVDDGSARRGEFIPLEVQLKKAGETYSPAHLLVAIPRQGFVLAPGAWYAAVLSTSLRDAGGLRLPQSPFQSAGGEKAALLQAELPRLSALLSESGRSLDSVVAVTLFKTGDHSARLRAIATAARGFQGAAPVVTRLRDLPDFTVLQLDVEVPLFQAGAKPYVEGGAMTFGADGAPLPVSRETVRVVVSVPRRPMPAGGFPLLFHAVGSGGDADSMVNSAGTGLALTLARRGIATWCADPNLTGLRHPGGDTSGFAFFNPFNPVAVRDNHRQQAAEYELFAKLAGSLPLAGTLVPEAGAANLRFDARHFFLHGHSTGSVVGAQMLASNRDFRAGALTGAGGSWLYNFVLKQATGSAELVGQLLSYRAGDVVDLFDPVLQLASIAWDPIEPMNQAPLWTDSGYRGAPASVLLVAGLTDTYYLPRMQAALAQAAKMDLVGPALEPEVLAAVTLGGGREVTAPLAANRAGSTQAVLQHAARAGRDGHFVVFDEAPVKHRYACFFTTAVSGGVARVVSAAASADAPCLP